MTEEKYERTLSRLTGVLNYDRFKEVDLVIEVSRPMLKFSLYLALCSPLSSPFWSSHFTRLIFLCNWFLFDHCIMAGSDWKCVTEAANICWFRKILLSPLHTCYKHFNNWFESNWRKNKVSRSNCWCTFLQVIWDKHMICVCVCVLKFPTDSYLLQSCSYNASPRNSPDSEDFSTSCRWLTGYWQEDS